MLLSNQFMYIFASIVLLLAVAVGCQSRTKAITDEQKTFLSQMPPAKADFYRILKSGYVLHSHDCSNKAAEYCTILRGLDLEADIYITDDDRNDDLAHAIVGVTYDDGSILYFDPTNGDYGTIFSGRPLQKIHYQTMHLSVFRGEFNFPSMANYGHHAGKIIGD